MTVSFPPPRTLPIRSDPQRFAVRRIYCIGANYGDPASDRGTRARPEPFFFTKPADAAYDHAEGMPEAVLDPGLVPYPPETGDLQFEVELVAAIGRVASAVSVRGAAAAVFGYAVGLDMTRRDQQDEAKRTRHPWDLAKGFDASAPCSEIVPAQSIGHPASGRIELAVDGETRQCSDLSRLIWSVPEIVARLSHSVTLRPGDLLFTGTPEGSGPVVPGQRIHARIEGVSSLDVTVCRPLKI